MSFNNKPLQIFGGLVISGLILNESTFNVPSGKAAILFDRLKVGVKNDIYREGLHFKIPFVEKSILMETRVKPHTLNIHRLTTKDLKNLEISYRALTRPVVEKLPNLYRNFGPDFDDKIVPSIVNEVVKSVLSSYDVQEIIHERIEISQIVREKLKNRLATFDVEFIDGSFIKINLPEYSTNVQ